MIKILRGQWKGWDQHENGEFHRMYGKRLIVSKYGYFIPYEGDKFVGTVKFETLKKALEEK